MMCLLAAAVLVAAQLQVAETSVSASQETCASALSDTGGQALLQTGSLGQRRGVLMEEQEELTGLLPSEPPYPGPYARRLSTEGTAAAALDAPSGDLLVPRIVNAGAHEAEQCHTEALPVLLVVPCTGTCNDAETIQAAVDEANSQGGAVVELAAGVFELNQSILVMGDNTVIRGAGRNRTWVQMKYPLHSREIKMVWPRATVHVLDYDSFVEIHAERTNLTSLEILVNGAVKTADLNMDPKGHSGGRRFSRFLDMWTSGHLSSLANGSTAIVMGRATYSNGHVSTVTRNFTISHTRRFTEDGTKRYPRLADAAFTFVGDEWTGRGGLRWTLATSALRGSSSLFLIFDTSGGTRQFLDRVRQGPGVVQAWTSDAYDAAFQNSGQPNHMFTQPVNVTAIRGPLSSDVVTNHSDGGQLARALDADEELWQLELDAPLVYSFLAGALEQGGNTARFDQSHYPILCSGIEALTVEFPPVDFIPGSQTKDSRGDQVWMSGVSFNTAWHCFARDLGVVTAGRNPLGIGNSRFVTVERARFDRAWWPHIGGGSAYLAVSGGCDTLWYDIWAEDLRHAPNPQISACRNVFRKWTVWHADLQQHFNMAGENLFEGIVVDARNRPLWFVPHGMTWNHPDYARTGSYGYAMYVQHGMNSIHAPGGGPRNVMTGIDAVSEKGILHIGGSDAFMLLRSRAYTPVDGAPSITSRRGTFRSIVQQNVLLQSPVSATAPMWEFQDSADHCVKNRASGNSIFTGQVASTPASLENASSAEVTFAVDGTAGHPVLEQSANNSFQAFRTWAPLPPQSSIYGQQRQLPLVEFLFPPPDAFAPLRAADSADLPVRIRVSVPFAGEALGRVDVYLQPACPHARGRFIGGQEDSIPICCVDLAAALPRGLSLQASTSASASESPLASAEVDCRVPRAVMKGLEAGPGVWHRLRARACSSSADLLAAKAAGQKEYQLDSRRAACDEALMEAPFRIIRDAWEQPPSSIGASLGAWQAYLQDGSESAGTSMQGTADLTLWLRPHASTVHCEGEDVSLPPNDAKTTDCKLQLWSDSLGQSLHAVPKTNYYIPPSSVGTPQAALCRPYLVHSSALLSGRPAIRFDSCCDGLETTDMPLYDRYRPRTLAVVAAGRPEVFSSMTGQLLGRSNNDRIEIGGKNGKINLRRTRPTDVTHHVSGFTLPVSTWFVAVLTSYANGTSTLHINGTEVHNDHAAAPFPPHGGDNAVGWMSHWDLSHGLVIGDGGFVGRDFVGDVGDVLLFSDALAKSQREDLERWLLRYYETGTETGTETGPTDSPPWAALLSSEVGGSNGWLAAPAANLQCGVWSSALPSAARVRPGA